MSCDTGLDALAAKFDAEVRGERAITLRPPFADLALDSDRTFDCVVAGGNLSWWEESDRQAFLEFLRSRLSKHGVAFLFVDTYPGARCLDLVRDIARIHCIDISRETIPDLFGILNFLAREGQHPAFREMMQSQLEEFREADPELVVRRLVFDRKVYSLQDLEDLAASLGLRCAPLEPTFRGAQWVALQGESAPSPSDLEQGSEGRPATIADSVDFPYPEYLHRRTSPESIASMVHAFGLEPPDPRRCRMLELGCGTGLSLLTFASAHPDASFVGVDLSAESIARARASAEAAGIRNVRFEAMDILDFAQREEAREFDYIVAHGVYSWTPEPVRREVLRICDQYLARNGVGFISFNARPGYHVSLMLRDAGMRFARNARGLVDLSRAAIEGLRSMAFAGFPLPGAAELVATRFQEIEQGNPVQAGFDEFGDVNVPVQFSSFIQEAHANHLRFVTEAEIIDWASRVFSEAAQGFLSQLESDPLRRMDYRDLIRLNSFHAALVCRQSSPPPSPVPVLSRLKGMLVSAGALPVSPQPEVRGETEERFETAKGDYVELSNVALKGFLVALRDAQPRRLPLDEAIRNAANLAGMDPQLVSEQILRWFPMFWESGFIQLHVTPAPAAAGIGVRPAIFPLARLRAARTGMAPSLTGGLIAIEEGGERRMLQLADGTRTVPELTRDAGLGRDEVESILTRWAGSGLFLA